ncbi:hypothetical protein E4U21_000522 [Claviceps maximensis]|nr:hypothetical protein E4U21_000522 [Claviceps maximensis]
MHYHGQSGEPTSAASGSYLRPSLRPYLRLTLRASRPLTYQTITIAIASPSPSTDASLSPVSLSGSRGAWSAPASSCLTTGGLDSVCVAPGPALRAVLTGTRRRRGSFLPTNRRQEADDGGSNPSSFVALACLFCTTTIAVAMGQIRSGQVRSLGEQRGAGTYRACQGRGQGLVLQPLIRSGLAAQVGGDSLSLCQRRPTTWT